MDPGAFLITVLLCAFMFGGVAQLLKLPKVLGYLIAGMLLAHLGVQGEGEMFLFLKEMGIVFLFFYIGLGLDFSKFREKFRSSARLGFWTAIIPFILGSAFIVWMGFGWDVALVVGFCLSVSAQAISIMVLEEAELLHRRIGRDIIEAGIVADFLQMLGLSLLFGLISMDGRISLLRLVGNWVVFLAAILSLKVLFLPWLLSERERSNPSSFFFGSVILALAMGYLAEVLGLGSILGALLAGALIRHVFESRLVNKLSKNFYLIGFGFLVPLLFVWTGYVTYQFSIPDYITYGAILAILALAGNLIGSHIAIPKRAKKEQVLAGIGLAAKGDMEVILATVMLEAAIITPVAFSMIITMSVITMLLAPALFHLSNKFMD